MDIKIREATINDCEEVRNIRLMKGVMENMLSYVEEDEYKVLNAFKKKSIDDYWFVAEYDSKVLGLIILNVHKNKRKSHVGHISIMINSDYHNKGIGTKLINKMINFADYDLSLKRLELIVFKDNEKAINLYKKFGFEIEGMLKKSALRNGKFSDELYMGRTKL